MFRANFKTPFSGDALQQVEASSNSFAVAGQRIKSWTIKLFRHIPQWSASVRKCAVRQWKRLIRFPPAEKEQMVLFDQPPIKAAVCGVDDAFSRSPSLSGAYLNTIPNGKLPSYLHTKQNNPISITRNDETVEIEPDKKEELRKPNAAELKYKPDECIPQLTPFFNKIFEPESKTAQYFWKIRCQCFKIVEHRIYETLLIFTILMSSIALVFEDIHLNSQNRSTLKIVLYWADVFFCVFFGVEMIMKVSSKIISFLNIKLTLFSVTFLCNFSDYRIWNEKIFH